MQIRSSNSQHFGMSFDFEKTDIARINDKDFLRLITLSKQDKFDFARISNGVKSLAIPQIDKEGKVVSLKVVTTAQDRDYGLKAVLMELSDFFKGKKAKFTKILRKEDINLENIKQAVNQTTISYKRRWLSQSLKKRIKNIPR